MKIKQLIEILQAQDPEYFVMIANPDGALDDVVRVVVAGPQIVELKTKPVAR